MQLKAAVKVAGQLLVWGKPRIRARDADTVEVRLASPELVKLIFCAALVAPTAGWQK